MKECPNCQQMCPDDDVSCRYCGEVFSESEKRPSESIGEGNTSTDDVHMDAVHSDSDERSTASVGNNNTFTGGVHSEDNRTTTNSNNKTNSDNKTYNTTIYQAKKSARELLEENLLKYRLKCKDLFKNGLISKDGEALLRELQVWLNLPDELVAPIKKEIQQNSRQPSTELSLGVIEGIQKTKTIIEQHSSDAIRRQLKQLESWMQVYDDESLKSWCYQLSSILDPVHFTERYEKSAKDEYWGRYWAHIAFMLQNKEEQAYGASACLGVLQANYPDQNEVLLRLVGRLIQNESSESIKKEFNLGAIYCSHELQLLFDTVNELLHNKWSQFWDVIPGTFQVKRSGEPVVRPVHSFYANYLFKSFINTQIEVGKKQREEEEQTSRAERQRQEGIIRQKGYLLKAFEEAEDIDKACAELSIPYHTFQEWIEEDSTFNSRYNAIVRKIEDKRKKEAERIRIAQETEARIAQQKSKFLSQYEKNDCDFIRTCSELGHGSDVVKTWRSSDIVFDDGLTIIERKYEKKLQELFIQFYETNGCDLQKASAETGVSVDIVNGWRKANKSFNEVLISIENEHVQAQKDTFVHCYENNRGDFLKTCSEISVSQDTVKGWLNADSSFSNSVACIKRKFNATRRKRFLAAVIPCILIAILCVIIGRQIKNAYDTRKETDTAINRYTEAIANLSTIIEAIPGDVNYISIEKHYNALVAGCDSLKTIVGLEKKNELEGKDESSRLRQNLLDKADIVYEYANNLLGTSSDVPGYEDERRVGLRYVNEINDLKQLISNVR